MAVIYYAGYITKQQAAQRYKVKLTTINSWMRNRKSSADKQFSFVEIDGGVGIKDHSDNTPPPAGIMLSKLALAEKVAIRNKMRDRAIFEQIILGNITGVVWLGRVFVISNEPALLSLLKVKRRKKV